MLAYLKILTKNSVDPRIMIIFMLFHHNSCSKGRNTNLLSSLHGAGVRHKIKRITQKVNNRTQNMLQLGAPNRMLLSETNFFFTGCH